MTAQAVTRHWRRAVRGAAVGALTAGLMVGVGTQEALADPETTAPVSPSATATSDTAQFASADELIAYINSEYNTGAGGGQLSNLIKTVMKYRAQGIKPSQTNVQEISEALDHRPNQKWLVEALQDTITHQQKVYAQTQLLQQAQQQQQAQLGAVMGAGQMPADGQPGQGGIAIGGGSTITQPIAP